MKLIKLIGLLMLLAVCSVGVLAQTDKKPVKKEKKFTGADFSGTWVLDENRSFDIERNVLKLPAPEPDPKHKITNLLVIEQKEFEFKVVFKRRTETFDDAGKLTDSKEVVQVESTFYGDKRGEKNKFNTDKQWVSETDQKGSEINIAIVVDGKKPLYNNQVFSLSKDGRELTFTNNGYKLEPDYTKGATFVSPGDLRSKKIYTRLAK